MNKKNGSYEPNLRKINICEFFFFLQLAGITFALGYKQCNVQGILFVQGKLRAN